MRSPAKGESPEHVLTEAVLSECGLYRYWLSRTWNPAKGVVGFIMLNPSTADASVDDPTIKKCMKFAHKWGYGGIEVANVFGFRSTDPRQLEDVVDPVGVDNDKAVLEVMSHCALLVVAWGGSVPDDWGDRVTEIRKLILQVGKNAMCFQINKDGSPKHPLYVADETSLVCYMSPREGDPAVLAQRHDRAPNPSPQVPIACRTGCVGDHTTPRQKLKRGHTQGG